MDTKIQLMKALEDSFDPKKSEMSFKALESFEVSADFIPSLFEIIESEYAMFSVRQAAAIYFKNYICKRFENQNSATSTKLREEEKNFIKNKVIEALIQVPNVFKNQLVLLIALFIKHDFPNNWQGLMDKVVFYLKSNELQKEYAALLCFYQICKKYQYKRREERERFLHEAQPILSYVLQNIIPKLLSRFDQEHVLSIKLVLKIFYSLIEYHLPKFSLEAEVFSKWMQFFSIILQVGLNRLHDDNVDTFVISKCIKWALKIVDRIFGKYVIESLQSSQAFSATFVQTYSSPLIQIVFNLLDVPDINDFSTIVKRCYSYLTLCLKLSFTWKVVKPHVNYLFEKKIFPLLCHSEEDQDEDPCIYVRNKYDEYESIDTMEYTAKEFIEYLVTKRKDALPCIFTFCVSVLMRGRNESSEDGVSVKQDEELVKMQDGSLNIIGSLSRVLMSHPEYKGKIESLLVECILPFLTHDVWYIRSRVAWIFGKFKRVIYSEESLRQVVPTILTLFLKANENIAARIELCISLEYLCSCNVRIRVLIFDDVSKILQEMIRLLKKTYYDELVTSLKRFFMMFQGEFSDAFAKQLVSHLSEALQEVCSGTSKVEEDDDICIVSMEVIEFIETIVSFNNHNADFLTYIYPLIHKVLETIFERMELKHYKEDYFEEVIQLMYVFTMKHIISEAWNFLPILTLIVNKDLSNFVEMMCVLHNFIIIGTNDNSIFKDLTRVNSILNICSVVLREVCDADNKVHALKLIEILVLQLACHEVDYQILKDFVSCTFSIPAQLIQLDDLSLRRAAIFYAAFYLNSLHMLRILSELVPNSSIEIFLAELLDQTKLFSSPHDKKIGILGILSIIKLCISHNANFLATKAFHFSENLIFLLESMKNDSLLKDKSRDTHSNCDESSDDNEDSFYDNDRNVCVNPLNDSEDDVDNKNACNQSNILTLESNSFKAPSNSVNCNAAADHEMSQSEDDDEVEDDDDDDVYFLDSYTSCIDKSCVREVSVLRELKTFFVGFKQQDQRLYTLIIQNIPQEKLKLLQEIEQI